jgi:hypothetical protein
MGGAATANPSGANLFSLDSKWGLCCSNFSFLCIFCYLCKIDKNKDNENYIINQY